MKNRFSMLSGLLAASGLLALTACATSDTASTATETAKAEVSSSELSASAERIRQHIAYLADDAREGREAGTAAYEEAAEYVAAEFKKLGLKPMGDDGTFFQQVPLVNTKRDGEAASMSVTQGGETMQWESKVDYLISAPGNGQPSEVSADLVFVGYGIDAPEFGFNDYEGLNVEGKIVVAFMSAPLDMPSEERAHYSSSTTRRAVAASKGAVGMINIYNDAAEKRFAWPRLLQFADRSSMSWITKDGVTFSRDAGIKVNATLSPDAAAKLFAGSEKSYEELRKITDEEGGKPKGFNMPVKVKMKTAAIAEKVMSRNVVAVLEGSDPELKNEYVVLSAHLDHIGKRDGVDPEQDHINNGAMDNASGIATTLEAARKFVKAAKNGEKPKRSILFVAVTAEEKGLVGSEYFAHNPTVPEGSMVANVNLDMPLILYPFVDAIAFGADHSTLGPLVREAAAGMGVEIIPDPVPQLALFVRSDHYRFVQKGIPAVFLFLGFGNGGEEAFNNFMSTNYHRPSDDITQDIDYEQGARFSELNYRIAREIANADERPRWNEGNFFGDLYTK
jgi:hypothetical protein